MHKLFSVIKEEETYYIIFKLLLSKMYMKNLTIKKIKNHFNFLNMISNLIQITKADKISFFT
jgi:hypothetical protein